MTKAEYITELQVLLEIAKHKRDQTESTIEKLSYTGEVVGLLQAIQKAYELKC